MPARVASADETRACEAATIESGISSAELMRRAGHRAASLIAARYDKVLRGGVIIVTGPGNNGGDGWIVAESFAKKGIRTVVAECGEPRSDEASAARQAALTTGAVRTGNLAYGEGALVIDALLGTGFSGSPRGEIGTAIAAINSMRDTGCVIASLDVPSGLDASSGEHGECVRAHYTVSFGVLKRGHLIARDVCGDISVVDIGLIDDETLTNLPLLVDDEWAHSRIPEIPVSAHKGTRKRLAVMGGGKGMAGAAILAAEGALRSGIGLVRIVCSDESATAAHAALPAALVSRWPQSVDDLSTLTQNEDCIAIGPGLGNTAETRELVERVLLAWNGPVVLDADGLNVFAGEAASLTKLLSGRPAILTPHPAEMGRLLGLQTAEVVRKRFEIGMELARSTGAVVLLKGSPTTVFSPSGERMVSASGTAALATGGSGDVLTGIAGTLLAQVSGDSRAAEAAACAAFIHGRAAERCRFVRGITLSDILEALPLAWNETSRRLSEGVIAELESHT
jgi:ADP-dependent NAD(P)H-hydrate dehydratase / NAD(P)H-hydrate epimerase